MLGFKQINSALVLDKHQVTKFQSVRSGLTAILAHNEDSTVHCSILIVTEPEDDEGYVHALEHLIFNGSEKHPNRGILNKLDKDCVAWTEINHTVFRFSATGQNQALDKLPIFLEHIMFPLLSEEDFILDVHHINEEGKDGGLVYDEMKDSYNTPYKRLLDKLMKEMYPNSGYSYDYYGTESALRLSTNNYKVKEFHKKYYQPENMSIILTGEVNHVDALKVLTQFEDEIMIQRNAESVKEWTKPWQRIPPPPNYGEYNLFHSIDYRDENGREKDGYMVFGWRGPVLSDAAALKELAACEILLDYLCWPRSASLHKYLIDVDEPLAGNVSSNIESHKISLLCIKLFDIPPEKMEQTKNKTLDFLKNFRSGVISFDMNRIKELVGNELKGDENKDSKWVHLDITSKYLFSLYMGNDEFAASMNPQWHLKELSEATFEYWLDIFRKYFTDDVVIVNGIPTKMENDDIVEKQRIEKQRELLGEVGLAEKAKILERAKKYREVSDVS